MKLRIRGNSVRLRVSQSELGDITAVGFTEDRARFAPGAELVYRLAVAPEGPLRADLAEGRISVTVPQREFERWLQADEVSIRGEQPIDGDERLAILVEKDFACLAPREGEDESDLFPNPAKGEC
jgi:hypothetical protein